MKAKIKGVILNGIDGIVANSSGVNYITIKIKFCDEAAAKKFGRKIAAMVTMPETCDIEIKTNAR